MKVLTANRLIDGKAVWLTANSDWSERLAEALVARHKEAEDVLAAIGASSFARNIVVDVNLVDVEDVRGEIRPTRLRERIRAAGPTVRPDLGIQAGQSSALAA